jgi:hypothetical protein
MRRLHWVLTALAVLGCAGVAAHRAGWFSAGNAHADHPAAIRPCGQATDRAGRQADLRYLQNQPRHWTYLLMQR